MFMKYILPEVSRKIADIAGMDPEIIKNGRPENPVL
jgi:hypothetical protein